MDRVGTADHHGGFMFRRQLGNRGIQACQLLAQESDRGFQLQR